MQRNWGPVWQALTMGEDPMREEEKNELEEIIDGLKCPKDFRCAQSGFELLCKAIQS